MHKFIFATLALTALVSSEVTAATSVATVTYNGIKYQSSSSSTCSDGKTALRAYRKWWCPVASTTPTTPKSYSASLSWTIPTTRADGKALSVAELKGYEVYYTNDSGSISSTVPVSGGTTVKAAVSNLPSGKYHFSISAVDTAGLKSPLSTMASLTFP